MHGMEKVNNYKGNFYLCTVHSGVQVSLCKVHTPYWDMLPHHRISNYDVTLLNVLISI